MPPLDKEHGGKFRSAMMMLKWMGKHWPKLLWEMKFLKGIIDNDRVMRAENLWVLHTWVDAP